MTRRIFRNSFFVGFSILLICALLFFALQYVQAEDEAYLALRGEIEYAQKGLAQGGLSYLRSLEDIHRVTWIDVDGTVLFDNEFEPPIASQAGTKEFIEAREKGVGQVIRRSGSSGKTSMYYAVRCEDGTVLRLSQPISAVRDAFIVVLPMVWMVLLVALISVLLSFRSAKVIVKPINALDLDHPDENVYPELSPLVVRIRQQNQMIQEQMDELNRKQREFTILTDSMQEGFLLLDSQGIVLSINRSALGMAPKAKVGAELLPCLEPGLSQVVGDALAGTRSVALMEKEGQTWEVTAGPVIINGESAGAVILIVDVTEREQREKLRREFSANVSHELKTPLTSIRGFAELMKEGLVGEEKTREFAGDIYAESQRLITLVSDILKISRLDERGWIREWEPVELRELCNEVIATVGPLAQARKVRLLLEGDSYLTILGNYRLVMEMVYNLCDNAIKYNKEGGTVLITVCRQGKQALLTVEDTGIGIPTLLQPRVFERFYRVDKSHSRELGGTGLGLSIVKHGAQVLRAKVSLESVLGEGTKVTLLFPLPEEEEEE